MSSFRISRPLLVAAGVCALLLCGATAQAQQYDGTQPYDQSQPADASAQAPGQVGRLAYLSGQVQFAPAGENDWGSVEINRPMVIGDRLLTGDDGLAVVELGNASVRVDNDSAFDFLNLTSDNVQIELSQGTLNMAVRQMDQNANFEVDTPTVAFVASTPGIYRIDDDPSGTGTMVTVFQGSGVVYGENGVSRQVAAGTSYRFNDSALSSVDVTGLPPADNFDRFCEARDAAYQRYADQPQQYTPPDMIGGDQLYQYGQWNNTPEYGDVWYPTSVPVGWAPYRYGHWTWIDPWGWTWVDNQPWGFAPFHYGRWVYAGSRWGWMPGPVNVAPVYAPALVAFIGGSGFSLSLSLGGGGPVGWFPLGPRDVYVPWFHASRQYFTNVNVTNIRNVYVNKTVINNYYGDYSAGRRVPIGRNTYAYRSMPAAVTAVPRNVFVNARPVNAAALRVNAAQLAHAAVAVRPDASPLQSSLGVRQATARPALLRGREPFTRPVVARHAPPPRPVAFAAREKLIASQHGQPLSAAQLQNLRRAQPAPAARSDRVKLVPALAGAAVGAAALDAMHRRAGAQRPTQAPARAQSGRPIAAPRPAEPTRSAVPAQPFHNTVRPIRAQPNPVRESPRPEALPSARFAHPEARGTLPRAPELRPEERPAHGSATSSRLPVVRPVERAPQTVNAGRAEQRPTTARTDQERAPAQQRAFQQQQSRQRVREQQMEQQRQTEMRSEQQAREAQMTQQRAVLQQRQEQMQEQRSMRMQEQRAAQMQEQRAAGMQKERTQYRGREAQRAPQARGKAEPERRAPARHEPPPSSSG